MIPFLIIFSQSILGADTSLMLTQADSTQISLPVLAQQQHAAIQDPNLDLVLLLSRSEMLGDVTGSWEVSASKPAKKFCRKSNNVILGTFSTYGINEKSEYVFALESAYEKLGAEELTITFTPISGIEGVPVTKPKQGSAELAFHNVKLDLVSR